MKRHLSIALLVAASIVSQKLLSGVSLGAEQTRVSASQPPNILLILTVDMGYSDLGCYSDE